MQRLCCLQCNRYLGKYEKVASCSIVLELFCPTCKRHTLYRVVEGQLQASEFLPEMFGRETSFG